MSDPNAGYINGNPAAGIQGSIPPAESIEYDQREVVNVISYAANNALIDFNNQPCVAPTNTLMDQLLKAIYGMIHKTSGTDGGGVVIKLQADADIYVNAATGDDTTADGTTGKPFKTLQAANDYAQQRLDLNLKHKIIFHCTGTFNTTGHGMVVAGLFAGQNGVGSIVWDMTAATVSATHGCAFFVTQGAQCSIRGGNYTATWDGVSSNQGIALQVGGQAYVDMAGMNLGACAGAHIFCYGLLTIGGTYTISGGAQSHIVVEPTASAGFYNTGWTVSILGSPSFTTFASVYGGWFSPGAVNWVGGASVSGKKFAITGFGLIYVQGAGVNWLPGNVAGTISNGEYS